jgi:plastocyanin
MNHRLKAGIAVGAVAALGSGATMAFGAANSAQSSTIPVTAKEFSFAGQKKIAKSGRYTFRLANRGRFPHNWVVVQGPVKFATATAAPGKTVNRTVRLRPGAYLAVCTIREGGHMAGGMVRTFTVGKQNQTTGAWSD